MKTLVTSVTAKDCEWQTFRAGGPGGQHQNKTSSGVRCTHRPSGAVGVARDSRSQHQNRRSAFVRMTESKEFQRWVRIQVARHSGIEAEINAWVKKEMLTNTRCDVFKNGRWQEEQRG